MKMNIYIIYIILSFIIALISVSIETNKIDKTAYGIKIFIISFITIYFGMMFLGSDSEIKHEIITGEPPF